MRVIIPVLVLFNSLPCQALTKFICAGINGNRFYATHRMEHGDLRIVGPAGESSARVLSLSPRRTLLQAKNQIVIIDLVPEEGDPVATLFENEKGIGLIWNQLEFSCVKKRYKN